MGSQVLGGQRLLHEVWAEGLQPGQRPGRLRDVPALVGVDHQQPFRAQEVAHRAHPFHVAFDRGRTHLELHRAVPPVHPPPNLFQQVREVVVQVHAAAVGGDPFPAPPEQIHQGHAQGAGVYVPQGDVDPGQGHQGQPGRIGLAQVPERLVP